MTAYGPDALSAAATPGAVSPGTPVQLTATINDSQNGGQNVAAAEYFLMPLHGPIQPWTPGTGTAMAAADGNWNSPVENVVATVDTSSLAPGAYLLALRGKDASNNWGPFTATFLYVVEPGVSPTIEGHVQAAGTGTPIANATVSAGMFGDTTDATGYYSMTVISGTYDMAAGATGYATTTVSGVVAHNYDVVQQNFDLYPFCDTFTDTVENGNIGWTAGGSPNTWAITTESSHSPSHSWTDSPGGSYQDNANNYITSPALDLSGYTGVELGFWHTYQTEAGYDYCYVEYSTNGGGTWAAAATYDGSQSSWTHVNLSIPALDGQANVRLRFRLQSDYGVIGDGWHVDDIVVRGGGPSCMPPMAPTAGFSSNSPVVLGDPVVFTNETAGSSPLSYFWDFGDGVGTSTQSDPQYTYLSAGTFTVTLAATNSLGSDSVSHPVVVEQPPCHGLAAVTIAGPTSGLPGVYTFTTSYTPPNATQPIAYLWDNGDTVSTTVRTLGVGTFTLAVTATNCTSTVAVDTHTITITPPCTDVAGVNLTQVTPNPIYTGTVVQFSADLFPDDAAKPYTYTIAVDGAAGPAQAGSADPLTFTETFAVTGTHTVAFAAWNCGMVDPVTDLVTVTVVARPANCTGLTGVTISGPVTGTPGLYTFTLSYEPVSATLPIGYLWDNGDTTITSTRLLNAGTYTLVVTATNCVDVSVVDTHTITVAEPQRWSIYLPLVVK
jgi:PKD repeat protein